MGTGHARKMANMRKVYNILRNCICIVLLLFLGTAVFLYLIQDSLVFNIHRISLDRFEDLKAEYPNCQAVELKAQDGVRLCGWYYKCPGQEKAPLLIHFGGNANMASDILEYVEYLDSCSVVSFNYRGYEVSEGKPSEKMLFKDALQIYDEYANREDVDSNNIFIMGYSLGTGIATYVASERDAAAVILAAPFDSITNLVKSWIPVLPVSLLLRHKFDSASRGPDIKAPLLLLAAENDTLIPFSCSLRLAQCWGGEYRVCIIEDKGHDNMWDASSYWESVREFIHENIE